MADASNALPVMSYEVLAGISVLLAGVPAWLFRKNLSEAGFRRAQDFGPAGKISVLIPARNEESGISDAIGSVLRNSADVQVIVLDDGSEDNTAGIAREIAVRDRRLRVEPAPPLPAGWCGKQHACSVLAQLASTELICFLDADVRLAPDALVRMAGFLKASNADLISGFPRQLTGTFLEKLLIPLIHFVLLAFLPLGRMRRSTDPAYAAGCGQLMFARRSAYIASGGHAAIRATLHDGLRLPRAFRTAGFKTDIFDATDIATCRMYKSATEVWSGLAKNAIEGLAAPWRIVPITLLLFCGQVLPFALLPFTPIAAVAALAAWYPRFAAVKRFHQSLVSAVLHPVGVLALLALQWYALFRWLFGKQFGWKGRYYKQIGAGERT